MRRLADAGHDDARGVRQLGAQHHRVPVCRGRRRRAVRRHAVRRGADALPAAPPAQLVAAAQVQDRVRRLRARSHRRGDQRHRLARAASSRWTGAPRVASSVTVAGGTATMVRAGHVLFEFLPVGEMFNVAEAIIRVFHRLGDYKHKQRNRLKFLVKSLGWDGFRAEFERELEAFRAARRRAAAVRSRRAAGRSGRRRPAAGRRRRLPEIVARAAATAVIGPGIVPQVEPRAIATPREFSDWSRTNVRPQKQAGWTMVVVATVLGDLDVGADAPDRRAGRGVRRRHGAGHVRSESRLPLGAQPRRRSALSQPARGRPVARRRRDAGGRDELPGRRVVQARRHAVARPRPPARGSPAASGPISLRRRPASTSRSAAARTAAASITSPGIGFQGSLRKVGGRPAPHYFVMVGGGVGDGSTTFGRHAATIPARRCDEAMERLIGCIRRSAPPRSRRWRSSAASSCAR